MNIRIESAAGSKVRILLAYAGQPFKYELPDNRREAGALTWYYARTNQETDELVLGMGGCGGLNLEKLRRAGGYAARALYNEGRSAGELDMAELAAASRESGADVSAYLQAWTEGWLLGLYRYDKYRGLTASERTVDLYLAPSQEADGVTAAEYEAAVAAARIRAEATMLTRDLVNETPEGLNPEAFVEVVQRHFADLPVKPHVYQGQELIDRQMNGLLAVGGGSVHEPALIELAYEGAPGEPMLAFVGKGVTFDMGGMNVKTGRDISDARMDMGGAAAVVGAMDILARTGAAVNVTALIAVVDNLPGMEAMLPSSVIRYPNGMTVQVANTDGEGRLVIADALLHAANLGAAKVIDIATLTGNVGAALGLGIAGIWGDEEMTQGLVAVGEINGERLWPMPLMDEYESELRSDYADLRNVGTGTLAGAITAALFIRRFVAPSMDWVHIDMAGTVQYKSDAGFSGVGATGYGARLLADYAKRCFTAEHAVNGRAIADTEASQG
ncbi:M17 family metallopeptidase [Paenibacillus gorillae]|uniref:M17 family metallopeptidase n=1 Tax=Paenibacillus gorillae TaxID=1243662 RepID=UPI0004BC26D1|nr:leucyl aminopeptidase family protein [Paenibacillus gorillae]